MTGVERGITVGVSWPRPTTPAPLVPRWEGEFCSHADWVNFASKRLTVAADSNGSQLKAICVDTLGRRCANGRDFATAEREGTFPVRYFWDCTPAPVDHSAVLLAALQKARGFVLISDHASSARVLEQVEAAIAAATGEGL